MLPTPRVSHRIKPDDDAPSVQSRYRTFFPTTDVSAPVPRLGTQTLAAAGRLGRSLCIGATGSCVPHRSLSQGHAAFMPDADWAVSRHLPILARGIEVQIPVSTSPEYVTTRHQRFTCVRLLETHLTEYPSAFSTTLTTRALYPRSLWRFEACSCRPTSGDRSPSSIKLSQHTTSSYLRLRHNRSTKMLSLKRPRPSMLMATPCAQSTPVKSSSVNWLPWSVLKISGCPWLKASSRASIQKLASSRFDKRHVST